MKTSVRRGWVERVIEHSTVRSVHDLQKLYKEHYPHEPTPQLETLRRDLRAINAIRVQAEGGGGYRFASSQAYPPQLVIEELRHRIHIDVFNVERARTPVILVVACNSGSAPAVTSVLKLHWQEDLPPGGIMGIWDDGDDTVFLLINGKDPADSWKRHIEEAIA